jgi:signal transduction histidine kinase
MGRKRGSLHQLGASHDHDAPQEAGRTEAHRDRLGRRLPVGGLTGIRSHRRLSVKARTALLCGGLFLVGGITLLCINFFLVRSALPTDVAVSGDRTTIEEPIVPGAAPPTGAPPTAGAGMLKSYRQQVLNTLLTKSSLALIPTLGLELALGWVVARRLLRPVHEVTATALRLSADSLDQRIGLEGPPDELTELADTFDAMLDRLATSFDSQRRFVANASHELRTPLAAQRTMIEVAMNRPTADAQIHGLGERLLARNERIESLIEGMLVLARSDRGLDTKHPVRLDHVVATVVDASRPSAERLGITLHTTLVPRTVHGDLVLLEQLATNLVDNAIKYNRAGGEVWIAVGDQPTLVVGNTGPMVPEAAVAELFEPFRRLRRGPSRADRGVGLGLSIVASIARAHAGSARATPRPGGGLDLAVRLPLPAAPAPAR